MQNQGIQIKKAEQNENQYQRQQEKENDIDEIENERIERKVANAKNRLRSQIEKSLEQKMQKQQFYNMNLQQQQLGSVESVETQIKGKNQRNVEEIGEQTVNFDQNISSNRNIGNQSRGNKQFIQIEDNYQQYSDQSEQKQRKNYQENIQNNQQYESDDNEQIYDSQYNQENLIQEYCVQDRYIVQQQNQQYQNTRQNQKILQSSNIDNKKKTKKKYQKEELQVKKAKPLQLANINQTQQNEIDLQEGEKFGQDNETINMLIKSRPQQDFQSHQHKLQKQPQIEQGNVNIVIDKKHDKCLKKLCKKNHKLNQQNSTLQGENEQLKWENKQIKQENDDLKVQMDEMEALVAKIKDENLKLKYRAEILAEKEKHCLQNHKNNLDYNNKQNQKKQVQQQNHVVEKIVEKPVEVIKHVVVEKIVEKPVEVIKTIEKPVEVIKEVIKEVKVPVYQSQNENENQQLFNQQQIQPQIQERVVEKIKEVPVEKIIEKIVEVPKIEIKEVIKEVFIEVPPKIPQPHFHCQCKQNLQIQESINQNQFNETAHTLYLEDQYNRLLSDYNRLRDAHEDLIEDFKNWRLAKDETQDEVSKLNKEYEQLQEEFQKYRRSQEQRKNEDFILIDQDRKSLIAEIHQQRLIENELRMRIDELINQMEKLTQTNHNKNVEYTSYINNLEQQLSEARQNALIIQNQLDKDKKTQQRREVLIRSQSPHQQTVSTVIRQQPTYLLTQQQQPQMIISQSRSQSPPRLVSQTINTIQRSPVQQKFDRISVQSQNQNIQQQQEPQNLIQNQNLNQSQNQSYQSYLNYKQQNDQKDNLLNSQKLKENQQQQQKFEELQRKIKQQQEEQRQNASSIQKDWINSGLRSFSQNQTQARNSVISQEFNQRQNSVQSQNQKNTNHIYIQQKNNSGTLSQKNQQLDKQQVQSGLTGSFSPQLKQQNPTVILKSSSPIRQNQQPLQSVVYNQYQQPIIRSQNSPQQQQQIISRRISVSPPNNNNINNFVPVRTTQIIQGATNLSNQNNFSQLNVTGNFGQSNLKSQQVLQGSQQMNYNNSHTYQQNNNNILQDEIKEEQEQEEGKQNKNEEKTLNQQQQQQQQSFQANNFTFVNRENLHQQSLNQPLIQQSFNSQSFQNANQVQSVQQQIHSHYDSLDKNQGYQRNLPQVFNKVTSNGRILSPVQLPYSSKSPQQFNPGQQSTILQGPHYFQSSQQVHKNYQPSSQLGSQQQSEKKDKLCC